MDGITNCMESIIIKEIEMMLELPLHERQKAYFQDLLNAAKPVKIVPAAVRRVVHSESSSTLVKSAASTLAR